MGNSTFSTVHCDENFAQRLFSISEQILWYQIRLLNNGGLILALISLIFNLYFLLCTVIGLKDHVIPRRRYSFLLNRSIADILYMVYIISMYVEYVLTSSTVSVTDLNIVYNGTT